MLSEHLYYCRVCGLQQKAFPWGPDGSQPSFDICCCCGVEFGYEDCKKEAVSEFRRRWLSAGMKWFDESEKPDGWDANEQLKNVPVAFRDPD